MQRYPAADPDAPLFVLGHGAGAGEAHPWMRRTATGLAMRGISVVTFDFPYMQEGRKLPDRGDVLENAFAALWLDVCRAERAIGRPPLLFAGGKSMGGRIASQLSARDGFDPRPSGLVFFGYPLHPPAKPSVRRDRHLPAVGVPMLFLHGTRDPFGSADEMRQLVDQLPGARLEIIDGGDHGLEAPRKQDPVGLSNERALDAAAHWMLNTGRPI